MIVRSGSTTGSPKASPGLRGDGVAGPIMGGAGGIFSAGFGCDGAAGLAPCATIIAVAGPAAKTSATSIHAAWRVHHIGHLRLLRRSGDSPVIGILAWFIATYGQSAFIRHIN